METEKGCIVEIDCCGKILKEGIQASLLQLWDCAKLSHAEEADAIVWSNERPHYLETELAHFKGLCNHMDV